MNISWRHGALVGIIFTVLGAESAWANSKFLNVQGKLTDSSGNPLTGSQTVTFRLYTSSASGSSIWTESQTVALSTGLFNVTLGSVTTLDSLSFTQAYYLGIQVAGDSDELSPRQPLGASAYAQGSLGDFDVGGSLTTNGSAWINGQAVIGGTATIKGGAFSIGDTDFTVADGSITANGSAWIGGQTVVAGTLTVQGDAFSVGGSTFSVAGGSVRIGGQGIVQGTMTVQGGAFSVGGATFSVAGGSVTLGGRLNAAAAGIKWADGTTSTTAPAGITATVSSVTAVNASNNNSNLRLCYATVTVTMNGGDAVVWFSGSMSNPSGGPVALTVLRNGNYVENTDITTGLMNSHMNTMSSNGINMSFHYEIADLAGVQSFCLAPAANSGTWYIPGQNSTYAGKAFFGVWERK